MSRILMGDQLLLPGAQTRHYCSTELFVFGVALEQERVRVVRRRSSAQGKGKGGPGLAFEFEIRLLLVQYAQRCLILGARGWIVRANSLTAVLFFSSSSVLRPQGAFSVDRSKICGRSNTCQGRKSETGCSLTVCSVHSEVVIGVL